MRFSFRRFAFRSVLPVADGLTSRQAVVARIERPLAGIIRASAAKRRSGKPGGGEKREEAMVIQSNSSEWEECRMKALCTGAPTAWLRLLTWTSLALPGFTSNTEAIAAIQYSD